MLIGQTPDFDKGNVKSASYHECATQKSFVVT